jgi:hypothetical protein
MADTLSELSYDYEEDGQLVRKEIDRAVLTRGGWVTMMFLFQELDPGSGSFRAPKMAIVRFKKSRGSYRKHSSFNISSEKQARQMTATFDRWYPKIAALTGDLGEAASDEAASSEEDSASDESSRRTENGEPGAYED